jgi:hypothetical protein
MNITIIALQSLVEAATRDPFFRCVEEIEVSGADLDLALNAQGVGASYTKDQFVLTLGQVRQRLAELTTDYANEELVEVGCSNCDMLLGAAETYPTEPVYCNACRK